MGDGGLLSHAHSFEVGSPILVLTGLTLLCCPNEVQSLLFGVLQFMSMEQGQFSLVTSGPALPLPQALMGGGISPLPDRAATRHISNFLS